MRELIGRIFLWISRDSQGKMSLAVQKHFSSIKNVLQFERKSSLQKWSQESQKFLRTIENVKLQDPLSLHFRGRGDTQKSKIHQFN
jgi:hypothetical protein